MRNMDVSASMLRRQYDHKFGKCFGRAISGSVEGINMAKEHVLSLRQNPKNHYKNMRIYPKLVVMKDLLRPSLIEAQF